MDMNDNTRQNPDVIFRNKAFKGELTEYNIQLYVMDGHNINAISPSKAIQLYTGL